MAEQVITSQNRKVYYSFAPHERIWKGNSLADVNNSEAEYFVQGTYQTTRVSDLRTDDLFNYHMVAFDDNMEVKKMNDWELKGCCAEFENNDQAKGPWEQLWHFQIADPFGLVQSFKFDMLIGSTTDKGSGLEYFEIVNDERMWAMFCQLLEVCDYESWIDYSRNRKA